MAMREQCGKVDERNPVEKKAKPCPSLLAESHHSFAREEKEQAGVLLNSHAGATVLEHTRAQVLQGVRIRVQLTEFSASQIPCMGIVLFSLVFYSMR